MKQQPAPFVLASILTSYPTPDMGQSIQILLNDPDVTISEGLHSQILKRAVQEDIQDLQSEYIYIFDHGRMANPLYETEYGRHRAMAKGAQLSDIAGFYHAFGFQLDSGSENMDMLDHVGIELEFYSLMLMKQLHLSELGDQEGVSIVEDGRRKFLQSHLGQFVRAIGKRPGVEGSEFYRSVFNWCADLIDRECEDHGLTIDQVDWVEGQIQKEDDMNCNISSNCTK